MRAVNNNSDLFPSTLQSSFRAPPRTYINARRTRENFNFHPTTVATAARRRLVRPFTDLLLFSRVPASVSAYNVCIVLIVVMSLERAVRAKVSRSRQNHAWCGGRKGPRWENFALNWGDSFLTYFIVFIIFRFVTLNFKTVNKILDCFLYNNRNQKQKRK